MRVVRQASKEILRRAVVRIAALAVALLAAGCSASSGDESAALARTVGPDAASCESTSLDDRCQATEDDEAADDQELNRDELERELDRIEQEISAPEP